LFFIFVTAERKEKASTNFRFPQQVACLILLCSSSEKERRRERKKNHSFDGKTFPCCLLCHENIGDWCMIQSTDEWEVARELLPPTVSLMILPRALSASTKA